MIRIRFLKLGYSNKKQKDAVYVLFTEELRPWRGDFQKNSEKFIEL